MSTWVVFGSHLVASFLLNRTCLSPQYIKWKKKARQKRMLNRTEEKKSRQKTRKKSCAPPPPHKKNQSRQGKIVSPRKKNLAKEKSLAKEKKSRAKKKKKTVSLSKKCHAPPHPPQKTTRAEKNNAPKRKKFSRIYIFVRVCVWHQYLS